MARKSRKSCVVSNDVIKETKVKTALYIRLSNATELSAERETIKTQESLILQYLADKPEFGIYDTYIDDGQTGTNFDRERFKDMIASAYKGEIDCIIVKDFSRFGRNSIETSRFLETILPELGIRFISINDNYDSVNLNAASILSMHLKNITNESYARDLSNKIKSSYENLQGRGKFLGSVAPYGYMKDPTNKHKLVVDEETSPIVRRIFQLRSNGVGKRGIANTLTDEEVETPSQYKYRKGILKDQSKVSNKWTVTTISGITTNIAYIGHIAQGKKNTSIFETTKEKSVKEQNWIIVKNTHEPIIEEYLFYDVKNINIKTKKDFNKAKNKNRQKSRYQSKLKCGNCGKSLTKVVIKSRGKEYTNYQCSTRVANKYSCFMKQVSELNLDKVLLASINMQIKLCLDVQNLMQNEKHNRNHLNKSNELLQKALQLETDLTKMTNKIASMYDDFADGLLSELDFVQFKDHFRKQESELKEKLLEIKAEQRINDNQKVEDNRYVKSILSVDGFTELTDEIISLLVEKIIVHKGNIEIVFKYKDEFKNLIEAIPYAEKGDVL